MTTVNISGEAIVDAATFHGEFERALGFPGFYGRNMNAWIDCMSHIDDPKAGMSTVHVGHGQALTVAVKNAAAFKGNCPEVWFEFLESAAFVNWRRFERDEPPLLAVSAHV